MGIISLEGLEFFSYHGFYKEERKVGNKYEVNISVEANFDDAGSTDLLQYTINYEELYKVIKAEMEIPSKLLESIAHKIITRVFVQFPGVDSIEVSIRKFNPPIGGICTSAKVTLRRTRDFSQASQQ